MTAQIGNAPGFTDARESTASASQDNSDSIANPENYADDASLNSRLGAIDGTYYSAENLARMTFNDKVYALRSNDDSASILGS